MCYMRVVLCCVCACCAHILWVVRKLSSSWRWISHRPRHLGEVGEFFRIIAQHAHKQHNTQQQQRQQHANKLQARGV